MQLKRNFMDPFAFYDIAKPDHQILHIHGLPPQTITIGYRPRGITVQSLAWM